MADKVNQEESIARVYQFLSKQKDWVNEADTNQNGRVEKSEFRSYLLGANDLTLWNGLSSNDKEDLIDKFWKTVDTNATGKSTVGSKKISNKYTLDSKEIQAMQDNVEAQNRINEFMNKVSAPSSLDEEGKYRWMKSVKESLINKAIQAIKRGSIDDITQEWIQNAFKLSSAKATADYTATAVIAQKLGNIEGYKQADDATLKALIDSYIATLEDNPKDEDTIIREITELITAYVDTAQTNSQESIDLLAQYGYSNYNGLNDLQIATLKPAIKEQILNATSGRIANDIMAYINANSTTQLNININEDAYSAEINAMIDIYLDNILTDKGANQFNSLKAFDGSQFVNTDEYEVLISYIGDKIMKLETAKEELRTYVKDVLGQNNNSKTRAIEDKFGSSELEAILSKIDSMTTPEEVAKLLADIKAAIDAIDKMLPDNFMDALKDVSIMSGESISVKLPDSTGKYSTGQLTYSIENGNSNISVDSYGNVTITGNQVGTFRGITVAVYNLDGEKLASKTITITVIESVADMLTKVTGWGDIDGSEHLEVFGKNYAGDDGHQLTDYDISSLYNNDAIIRLDISEKSGDRSEWDNGRSEMVIERLVQVGEYIVSALCTTGNFDRSILQNATSNVLTSYINAGPEIYWEDHGSINSNTVEEMDRRRSSYSHKIIAGYDDDGSTEACYMIRFKDLLDDIIKEYQRLSSK